MLHKYKSFFFIGVFFLLSLFPLINSSLNIFPNYNIEKKAAVPKPVLNNGILPYINEYNTWYKSNFSGRSVMFSFASNLIYKIFNSSIKEDRVVVGKEGFFFLGNKSGSVIDESLGIKIFNDNHLSQIEREVHERSKYCDSLGIVYILAIAPNKHTTYKDKLPYNTISNYNRIDQILNKLTPRYNVINLGKDFEDYKKDQLLYYKTNSHWNKIGGYYGYEALMEYMIGIGYKDLKLSKSDFNWTYETKDLGDLTKMIDLSIKESRVLPQVKKQQGTQTISNSNKGKRVKVFKNNNKKYNTLILRDSYTSSMVDYLKHTFNRITLVWNHEFNKEDIEKLKPNIVIQIIVERNLDILLNDKK